MVVRKDMLVVVWADYLAHLAGTDLFATDDERNFYYGVALTLKLLLESDTFR